MFKLMTIALLSSTIALGPCLATSERVDDRQLITTENVKRATYDDNNATITLTANELNSYTWDNFSAICGELVDLYPDVFTSFDYNGAINSSVSTPSGEYLVLSLQSLNTYDGVSLIVFNEVVNNNRFVVFNDYNDPISFDYGLLIELDYAYYDDIKHAIELDIQANTPTPSPTTSLFDSIYEYFDIKVFDSEYLNEYEMEIMGHTTSMRHYLCLTATIIFITLIVIFCVGFIVMLVKFVANMLINLGR